jgi:subfamily B ATP-binding cassette protein MsbA
MNWRLTSVTIVVLAVFGGMLAFAFKKLRPIFRERNQINAEVTGRLTESLGGIRIVKAYTAEKREELSFSRGAHRLFRNIAKSLTGVSAIGAFSSLVIGAISVVMILIGGNAVMAGSMTIGELFMYIFFTGLMAFPIIELTSIGTQITDAFAGLDRIREILDKTTDRRQNHV